MSLDPLFSLSISTDVPAEDREALLLALRGGAEIQESTSRVFGPEWVVFIAVMKDIGVVAGTATALVKLANEISTWVRNARQHGIEPKVQLKRPDRPLLDLETATEEEVRQWVAQSSRK